jgi:hypothetical protein
MADSLVWAPIWAPSGAPSVWPAAYVPRTWSGLVGWDKDGPMNGPAPLPPDAPLGLVYARSGPRLVCVTCNG